MLQTELSIIEISSRLHEDLTRLPVDDFISALESALMERQADSADEVYRNIALTLRELANREYELLDGDITPIPNSRPEDFKLFHLSQGPPTTLPHPKAA